MRTGQLSADVREAIAEGTRMMMADNTGNIHRVYWGRRMVGGRQTTVGRMGGVIFSVKEKGQAQAQAGAWIRPSIRGVLTDVQQAPQAKTELLRTPDHSAYPISSSSDPHQQCHNTPIPGGVEIQPVGKQWLGTLGCKVVYRGSTGKLFHGATTNWHVATGVVGQQIVQPGGSREWFAQVARSPGVKFDGSANYVDLAILNISRTEGAYSPLTHTVKPEQVTLGTYPTELSTGGLGTKLCRDGRTLGRLVDGVVTGIGASVRVGYGPEGTALFVDQIVASHPSGNFSAPGDSGSMVFEWPSMRPFGKLFAGGGGSTIISPAKYMKDPGGVHSFE